METRIHYKPTTGEVYAMNDGKKLFTYLIAKDLTPEEATQIIKENLGYGDKEISC